MSRTARVAGGFSAMSASILGRAVLAVLLSVLTARALGPTEMGRYSFLVWLVGLLAVAVSLGIPMTVTRFTAEAVGAARPWVGGALLVNGLARQVRPAVAAAVVVGVAGWFPGVPAEWRVPLLLAAANIPLIAWQAGLTAFLHGLQAFTVLASTTVAYALLQLGTIGLAVATRRELTAVLVAVVVTNVIAVVGFALLAWRVGRRHGVFPRRGPLTEETHAEASRYGRSVIALLILDMVIWQRIEVIFLQAFSTPAQVAFYSLAFGLAFHAGRLPYQASRVLFPAFPEAIGAGRGDQLGALHASAMRYLVMLGAPVGLGLGVTAPALVRLLYGEAYAPAATVLAILGIGNVFAFAGCASPAVLHAVKAQQQLVRQGMIAAGVDLGLTALLVPLFGAPGAAVANVGAQALSSWLAIGAARRVAGRAASPAALLRIVAAAVVMTVPVAVVLMTVSGPAGLACAVLVGAFAYLLCLRAFGAFTEEDRSRLRALSGGWPRLLGAPALRIAALLVPDQGRLGG